MNFNSLPLSPGRWAACGMLGLYLASAYPALAQETPAAPQVDPPAAAPTGNPSPGADPNRVDAETVGGAPGAAAPSIEQLRAQVREWDKKRSEAANAMFRLGEVYRRQKMFDQAQRSYGRVAKEFQDFPELAKESEGRLAEMNGSVNAPGTPGFGSMMAGMMARSTATLAEQPAAVGRGQTPEPGAAGYGTPRSAQGEKWRAEASQRDAAVKAAQDAADAAAKARAVSRLRSEGGSAVLLGSTRGMAGYSDAMGRGKIPTATEQIEMRAIEVRAFRSTLQEEQTRLKTVISLIQNAAQPEAFSSDVIDDPRYRSLKDKFEQLILNEGSDAEIETAVKRIKRWLDRIYLPELGSSCDFAEVRLKKADEEADELDKKLASMKKDSLGGIGFYDPNIAPPAVAPGTTLSRVFVPGPPPPTPTANQPQTSAPGRGQGSASAPKLPDVIPEPAPLPDPPRP